ncbi:MAG: hypothetical protein ACRD6X_09670 [Pyrinomonadaceae bacterium]
MLLSFLLVVTIFVASVSSQSSASDQPIKKARLTNTFVLITFEHLRALIDSDLQEINQNNKHEKLYFINWGSFSEVFSRKKAIRHAVQLGNYDLSLVEMVRAGSISPQKTEMWIVPVGAEPPKIEPEAYVAMEFGRVYKSTAVMRNKQFFAEMANNPNYQAYIINYGTPKQIALREKWITEQIFFRDFDRSRITLVRGGKGRQRTVMWLVPPGAANPAV